MNTEWLSKIQTFLGYLLLPFRLLFSWLLYVLSWLLAPLVFLGSMGVWAFMLPVRFLAQFETFYIFFGVAIGIGIVFGLAIHFMERFGAQIFGFDQPKPPRHEAAIGHSAKSYRAAREMKKQKLDEELRKAAQSRLLATEPLLGVTKKGRDPRRPLTSPTSPKQRAGLLSTTILEEEDDSDKDF